MKITAIHASPNRPSNSTYLGEHFLRAMKDHDPLVQIEVHRLYDYKIKPFTLEYYQPDCVLEPDFCKIKDAIISADALLITTPIWNFGTPAVLKNLIDHIGSFALYPKNEAEKLHNKPIFILFTGGAPLTAWKGMLKKTTSFVGEGLGYMGLSYVDSYYEPRCTVNKGIFGLVVDKRPESLQLITSKAQTFHTIVTNYIRTGSIPKKVLFKKTLFKWGQPILEKFFK